MSFVFTNDNNISGILPRLEIVAEEMGTKGGKECDGIIVTV